MSMHAWNSRVVEEAFLFNPAFCAAILGKASTEFAKKSGQPLPFSLCFLILPIVLHRATRSALPHSTITSVLAWIQDNREHLVDFAGRVQHLASITREAILFGVQHGTLSIASDGAIQCGASYLSPTEKRTGLFTDEARDCIERAGFLGRWFAAAGTATVIYAAWGVRP